MKKYRLRPWIKNVLIYIGIFLVMFFISSIDFIVDLIVEAMPSQLKVIILISLFIWVIYYLSKLVIKFFDKFDEN